MKRMIILLSLVASVSTAKALDDTKTEGTYEEGLDLMSHIVCVTLPRVTLCSLDILGRETCYAISNEGDNNESRYKIKCNVFLEAHNNAEIK